MLLLFLQRTLLRSNWKAINWTYLKCNMGYIFTRVSTQECITEIRFMRVSITSNSCLLPRARSPFCSPCPSNTNPLSVTHLHFLELNVNEVTQHVRIFICFLQRACCRPLKISLCIAFSFPVLCPVNSRYLGPPDSQGLHLLAMVIEWRRVIPFHCWVVFCHINVCTYIFCLIYH